MRSTAYLRIAAVLTLVHCLGHTARTMLIQPESGTSQTIVVQTMRSYVFNFAGFRHSYWDFYRGFGWFLTVQLASQGIAFWYFASLAKAPSSQLRPILWIFALNFAIMAILSVRYFTLGPIIIEIAIAASLVGSIVSLPPEDCH